MLKKILALSLLGFQSATAIAADVPKLYFAPPPRVALRVPTSKYSSRSFKRRFQLWLSERSYSGGGLSCFVFSNPKSYEVGGPAITLTGGVHILQTRIWALTLSSPLSLGGYSSRNSRSGFGVFDVPIMIDVNVGSLKGNKDAAVGLRGGVGLGYSYGSTWKPDKSGSAWGLRYNAGFALGLDGASLLLLATWRTDREPGSGNLFGVSLLFVE